MINNNVAKLPTASRLHGIEEYYFSQKLQQIAALNAAGTPIINLGIGSPDMPPHPLVVKALTISAALPNTHSYQSYKGTPALREAIATWYYTHYHVTLNATTEVLPLMGSKEGIMHLCMAYLQAGDIALIPNPGYPTYSSAATLAGATCGYYNLVQGNHWLPNYEEIEASTDMDKVKLLFVNYPHMPTGATCTSKHFESIINFAHKHNLLVLHDNPYSHIGTNNPQSILQVKGASEVCVELNSLSKSLNMAGWRVGMLVGNATVISNALRFKSNMDSGMYLPVQQAAIAALQLPSSWYTTLNETYASRQLIALQIADALGCTYQTNQQGLFVWAKLSSNTYADGYAISDAVLVQCQVFITPGAIFGSNGNQYIRISLCQPNTVLQQALESIHQNFIH